MGKVLGRVRLSRFTDESTSEARQREIIERWASMHDHEIVGWAVDLDVSRSVDPFETPDLGAWLTDPEKRQQWDVVACWKLDRLATGSIYLNSLMAWCQQHDKSMVSVTESFDLSTWVGRMIANMIAGVAEGELEAIKERTQGSQKKVRALGRWHGGTVPYGYQAVKRDGGWYLEIEPEAAKHVRWMVEQVLAGESLRGLVRKLNDDGVPSAKGGEWTTPAISAILKGRRIIGQSIHKGKVVTDESGLPLQAAEPLIPYGTWKAVQQKLGGNQTSGKRINGASLLLGIAFCALCGEPLYHLATPKRGGGYYHYWRCSGKYQKMNGCTANSLRADELEEFTAQHLLDEIGNQKRKERVFIPPDDDASAEIDQIDSAIATVRQEKDLGLYEGDDAGYFARLTALMDRRKALSDTEKRESGWVVRELPETFREAWERPKDRRQILLDAGIKVMAAPGDLHFYVPKDVKERVTT